MNRSTLKTLLRTYLVLIVDYREQDRAIELKFAYPQEGEIQQRLNAVRFPLISGDFSFLLLPNEKMNIEQPIMFHEHFLIERKSGISSRGGAFAELRGNIFKGHKKFKQEFQYPAEHFHLLLENTDSPQDIYKVKERGHIHTLKGGGYNGHAIANEQYFKAFTSFISNRNKERTAIGLDPIQVIHCKKEESHKIIKNLIFEYVFNLVSDGEI